MMKPIAVAVGETVAFLAVHLPPSAEVLEVGCGEGDVALELQARGHHVSGLDSDQEVVARARRRGAPVVHATWPEFEGGPFDAVAFTRSLHHIGPLDRAVVKAREALRPHGTLLVEDFEFDEADEATIAWFVGVLRRPATRALIDPSQSEFISELVASDDSAEVWHRHHNHELHNVPTMMRSITKHFNIRESLSVPYLYRYLVPILPDTPEAAALVRGIFEDETQHAGALIGRRVVGSLR